MHPQVSADNGLSEPGGAPCRNDEDRSVTVVRRSPWHSRCARRACEGGRRRRQPVTRGAAGGGGADPLVCVADRRRAIVPFLGPPIVHLAHERPGAAAGSFGLHVGLVAGGAIAGYAMSPKSQGEEPFYSQDWVPTLAGAIAGYVLAAFIDVAFLSEEPIIESARPPRPPSPDARSGSPLLAIRF